MTCPESGCRVKSGRIRWQTHSFPPHAWQRPNPGIRFPNLMQQAHPPPTLPDLAPDNLFHINNPPETTEPLALSALHWPGFMIGDVRALPDPTNAGLPRDGRLGTIATVDRTHGVDIPPRLRIFATSSARPASDRASSTTPGLVLRPGPGDHPHSLAKFFHSHLTPHYSTSSISPIAHCTPSAHQRSPQSRGRRTSTTTSPISATGRRISIFTVPFCSQINVKHLKSAPFLLSVSVFTFFFSRSHFNRSAAFNLQLSVCEFLAPASPHFLDFDLGSPWPADVLRAAPLNLIAAEENVIVALPVVLALHVGNPQAYRLRLLPLPTLSRLDTLYPKLGLPVTFTLIDSKNTN